MQENSEKNKDLVTVPYFVYESAEARSERYNKRVTIALIISIILLFVSNALWLYMWCQYDYIDETSVSVEGEGNANYIGQDGEIYNGKDSSKTQNVEDTE